MYIIYGSSNEHCQAMASPRRLKIFDCGFGYFKSVLCTFQTSIQLTVVTSERLFSDFWKAVLAEVGAK